MQNQIYPTAATIVHKTLNDLATVCKVCTVHSNTELGEVFPKHFVRLSDSQVLCWQVDGSNSLIPAAIVSDSSMSVDILSGVQWSSS